MRPGQSALRLSRHLLWLDGEPDPRAVQLGFVALMHLSLLGTQTAEVMSPDPEVWALRLSTLSLVVTFLVTPRVSDHRVTVRVLATVDLALIGVTALSLDVGTLPLVVLPAMWLARELGWRSLWRVVLSTTVLVTLPGTLVHGNDDGTALQLVSLPFVAAVAAITVAVGLDSARQAQAEAERQRAEAQRALAALEEQRRATDAIVETVDVGLALLDRDGQVVLRNRHQLEIDAVKYPGGRGQSPPAHVYDQDGTTPLPEHALPSTVAASGEEFDDFRIWIGESTADRRALSVSARQVYDERGERVGTTLAYKDVTDLMHALQVKGDFIALVSHELRTPLTSIHGYASILLEDDTLPSHATRQLEVVARNTDRLEALVDDLLDAAQLANGALRLRPEPTDLARLVWEAVRAAAPAAEAADVTLDADVPASVHAEVDPSRISQVLDNLVSNAIKYTPPGGWARVELHTFSDRIEVRVADSGIGIRADELVQLFRDFFRTEEASHRAIPGVGLGLSISRTIAEKHGGRLEVTSQPGRGSVFTLVLPIDQRRGVGSVRTVG